MCDISTSRDRKDSGNYTALLRSWCDCTALLLTGWQLNSQGVCAMHNYFTIVGINYKSQDVLKDVD